MTQAISQDTTDLASWLNDVCTTGGATFKAKVAGSVLRIFDLLGYPLAIFP